jgi:hypothetical protein
LQQRFEKAEEELARYTATYGDFGDEDEHKNDDDTTA